VTALYRTFFGDTGPGSPFASMRRYVSAHPTSPHSLAGAMWLAYLPERLHREGILGTPGGVAGRRAHGRFELVCQLAAMMALAHDFPVDSARKQGEQGFSLAGLAGRSLLDCYPCCTLFTLADVLHEFGRPFLRTGPDAVRVRAPVLGIQLRRRDEWYDTDYIPGGTPTQRGEANGRCAKRGLLTDDDLEAARTAPRIEVFWVTEDPQGHFLDPDDGTATPHSTFDPAKVGNDVPARLHGWGLSSVLCQRDVEAARRLDRDPPFKPPRVTAPDGLAMAPSPPPRPGMLAVFPLAEYRDAERGPRDLLGLGTLQ